LLGERGGDRAVGRDEQCHYETIDFAIHKNFQFKSGFPIWLLAYDQREPFCDFLPSPQVSKSFFQSALGISLAKGA
jgi:hypothetical protein